MFQFLTGNIKRTKVNQHKVIISTAGNKIETSFNKSFSKSLCVLYYLLLIGFKFRFKRFSEAYCLAGNYMHKRTALYSRKN